MPELPDVEGFRRYLAEHATGQRIQRVTAPDAAVIRNTTPQGLGRAVKHRFFGRPERHGKWLLACTQNHPPARSSGPSRADPDESCAQSEAGPPAPGLRPLPGTDDRAPLRHDRLPQLGPPFRTSPHP